MSDVVYSQPSASANLLTNLRAYRDFLTELIFRQSNPLAPFQLFETRIYGMQTDGLTGFGVGFPDGSEEPVLLIIAERATNTVGHIYSRLHVAGIPVNLQIGVSFVSAARPLMGGQSIGHGSIGGATGTMGCVVQSRLDGSIFALTCNHVIADHNSAIKGRTEVWAPGPSDSGTTHDRLGVVHDFANLDFAAGAYNTIDAALAKPDRASDLDAAIDKIGSPSGTNLSPRFGNLLRKMGSETGYTTGKYRYDMNAEITYPNGRKALFRDMLGIVGQTAGTNFAAQGDSGAVVLDEDNAVVGQIISVASGLDLTLATAIEPVTDYFQVDIV